MAHSQYRSNRPVLTRVGSLVAGSTVALTLAFFGVLALASGGVEGVGNRVPFYVLAAAVTFAAALFVLDRRSRDGRGLLAISVAVAVAAFVLFTLGLEGVAYAVASPGETVGTNRLLYLVSAALVTTGLGYWATNHWQEIRPAVRRW